MPNTRGIFALLVSALALALVGVVPAMAGQSASNSADVTVGDVEQSNSIGGEENGNNSEFEGNSQSNENSTDVNVDQSITQHGSGSGSQSADNDADVTVGEVEQENLIGGEENGNNGEFEDNEQSNENETNVDIEQDIRQLATGHAFGHGGHDGGHGGHGFGHGGHGGHGDVHGAVGSGCNQSASNNADVNIGDVEQSNELGGEENGNNGEFEENDQSNENTTNVTIDQSISQVCNVSNVVRGHGHGHGHGALRGVSFGHGGGHGVGGGVAHGGGGQLAFGGFDAGIVALLGASALGTGFFVRRRALAS